MKVERQGKVLVKDLAIFCLQYIPASRFRRYHSKFRCWNIFSEKRRNKGKSRQGTDKLVTTQTQKLKNTRSLQTYCLHFSTPQRLNPKQQKNPARTGKQRGKTLLGLEKQKENQPNYLLTVLLVNYFMVWGKDRRGRRHTEQVTIVTSY